MPNQNPPKLESKPIRLLTCLMFASLFASSLAGSELNAVSDAASDSSLPGAVLFTKGALVQLTIELSPASLESLRKEPRRKVPAIVKEGDRVYHDVAIHLKGASGSFRNVDDKPGLTLNFQHTVPGQKFHGLRKIMLNNSVQDPTYLNEKLAGDLFRAADVPAPRTSHALVELNGRKLGLYVLKEGFSKDFLGLYFKKTSGNFYDINQGFYDLGPGSDLQKRFRLDSGDRPAPLSDLAALIDACQEKEPARRWEKLQGILDLDRFISYMAMEIITCHVDGYSVYGHNFRIYNDPTTHKLVFIPNDMDRMFQESRPSCLDPGFSAQAAAAVFRTPQGQQRYAARCAWLSTNVFQLEKLTNQVNELSSRLRPVLESWQPQATKDFDLQIKRVCERLQRRAAAIKKELNPGPAPVALKSAGSVR